MLYYIFRNEHLLITGVSTMNNQELKEQLQELIKKTSEDKSQEVPTYILSVLSEMLSKDHLEMSVLSQSVWEVDKKFNLNVAKSLGH